MVVVTHQLGLVRAVADTVHVFADAIVSSTVRLKRCSRTPARNHEGFPAQVGGVVTGNFLVSGNIGLECAPGG